MIESTQALVLGWSLKTYAPVHLGVYVEAFLSGQGGRIVKEIKKNRKKLHTSLSLLDIS